MPFIFIFFCAFSFPLNWHFTPPLKFGTFIEIALPIFIVGILAAIRQATLNSDNSKVCVCVCVFVCVCAFVRS